MQNTKKTKASNETNEYSPNFLYFQKKELSYK